MNRKRLTTVIALACGIALFVTLPLGMAGEHERCPVWRWIVAAGVSIVGAIASRNEKLGLVTERFNAQSGRNRWMIAVAIAVVCSLYFIFTAINQDRDFFPFTHDECSYAIQTQMLACGHLWMPQHPLADFFDSFYLITKPVYASMYFPGTAVLNAPGVWLHLPFWCIPVLIAGAIVGLVYRIIAEILDPLSGLLAAFLIVSLSWYRLQSIMIMSQLPELLLGLLAIWAWLRWRASGYRSWRWLLLIGLFIGWAAITRPVDAICFALPIGVGVVGVLKSDPRKLLLACLFVLVGSAPFMLMQLIDDRGITGRWLQTPFDFYADRNMPGTTYGFHPLDPHAVIQSVLPQKRMEYDHWAIPFIQRHQQGELLSDWWRLRLPAIASATLPARPLVILLPIGLLGLTNSRRWLLFAAAPMFVFLYVGYTFFLEHYCLVIAPAIALLVLLSIKQIRVSVPSAKWLGAAVAFAVIGFAATDLWELNHWDRRHSVDDVPFRSSLMRSLHELKQGNGIVLFRFPEDSEPPNSPISAEPVYNIDTAWPDNAPLIRAHDLGPRDAELFDYYAKIAPNRDVQIFDRKTGQVQDLGSVGHLAHQSQK